MTEVNEEEFPAGPGPCVHSGLEPECASCWYGQVVRQWNQELRVRQLIEDHGSEDLKQRVAEHDRHWLGGNAPESSRARW